MDRFVVLESPLVILNLMTSPAASVVVVDTDCDRFAPDGGLVSLVATAIPLTVIVTLCDWAATLVHTTVRESVADWTALVMVWVPTVFQ